MRRKKKTGEPAPAGQKETPPSKPYVPTERELAALTRLVMRREELDPRPRLKVENDRGVTLKHDDLDIASSLLMQACGVSDSAELETLVKHFAEFSKHDGRVDVTMLNSLVASVAAMKPRDSAEAMLAAQMAMTHDLTMRMARWVKHAETIPQHDVAERSFNKLARTFSTQMEALRKHRTGGQQKVTVEHVTVNEGGQAIVGNVEQGGRGAEKNRR